MRWGILIVFTSLALIGCGGERDIDKVGDAQACLDKVDPADASAVDQCLEPIRDLSGPGVESLRCTASFMKEGLATGERILKGFERFGGGSGSSETIALLEILSFTSSNSIGTNFQNAETAFQSCYKSEAKGATLLASFSYLTMSLLNFMSSKTFCTDPAADHDGVGFDYYDLETCFNITGVLDPKLPAIVELVNANSVDAAAIGVQNGIGSILITTARLSCPENGAANKEMCAKFNQAIENGGGVNQPRAVAVEFFGAVLGLDATP